MVTGTGRLLRRKVVRDLWHLRGQMLAVAVVMACGIAMFVTLRSMHGWLRRTQQQYYADYRFGDAFAHLRRAPAGVAADLRRLPGVTAVRTRLVADVTLDVAGLAEPATGRLVSIPEARAPMLNDLYLRSGRWIGADPDEVIVSAAFATANGLAAGDRLPAVLNGRWRVLRIVGTALSPEYIYEIRGLGDVFPDNRRFGVVWMGEHALAAALDMTGAFNDVVVATGPAAPTADVIAGMDRLLAPYGTTGAYPRADQLSHRFVSSEIEETQVTSVLLPSIFLGVTAFLLHMVLGRLVSTQREQIAVLKAFGYSNGAIALHYLELALGPIAIGSLAGVVVGLRLADGLAAVYARFYQFPVATFSPDWSVVALALVVSAGAAGLGALGSVRRVVRLPPAEAMRPEAPAVYRAGLVERLGWDRLVGPAGRMVVRGIERRPAKALLSVLGIALATAVVVTGWWMWDAIDVMKEIQFEEADRYDAMVTFEQPRSLAAAWALGRVRGVRAVEAFRAAPVRFERGPRRYRGGITGLEPGAEMARLVDRYRTVRAVPEADLLLSQVIATRLGVRAGDTIAVTALDGKRRTGRVVVADISDDIIGSGATMSRAALAALLGEGETISGAYLRIDRLMEDSVYRAIKRMPAVNAVVIRAAVRQGFERTVAESFMISITTMVAFASVIAAGIVYNGARVSLSERGRDLASLRVLGFTRSEVSRLLLGEQFLLTLAGIPVGCGLGYTLAWLVSVRFESDLFRIPLEVRARPYLLGATVVIVTALLTAAAIRRRIHRLDLVAVLKTRE